MGGWVGDIMPQAIVLTNDNPCVIYIYIYVCVCVWMVNVDKPTGLTIFRIDQGGPT